MLMEYPYNDKHCSILRTRNARVLAHSTFESHAIIANNNYNCTQECQLHTQETVQIKR